MVRSLNNYILLLVFMFGSISFRAQTMRSSDKDYHNKGEFKKFGKRADQVAAWQIQNLRFGAIVVRLQTNKRKVDALKKVGDEKKALEVMAETEFYNKLMIKAYTNELKFCKVYFMYAHSSDSLLKGTRKGIFIDSNLRVNAEIEMTEKFYVLAEKDFVYSSSIGFVKEDTAKYISENGNKVVEVAVVLKNKYGHQLKDPFPYFVKRSIRKSSTLYIVIAGIEISPGTIKEIKLSLSKDISLERQSYYLNTLNSKLSRFYNDWQGYQINDPSVKPFLY